MVAKKATVVDPTDAQGRTLIPKYPTSGRRTVRLTFDDGPHPTETERVLETLAANEIKATFFMLGQNVQKNPGIVQQVAAGGHSIGNHTYTHPNLVELCAHEIRSEIERTDELLAAYLGDSKLFRPPYGSHDERVDAIVAELGYRIISWNVDTLDWDRRYQSDKWVQHGIDQIREHESSTVLNHDVHKTTADHLDDFIARINALGLTDFEVH